LEIADGGTVLLDDIDSLDIGMQGKLLRAIQEKEFQKLGGTKVIKVDIRFLAASNKDIKTLISQGKFREDLFFRLHVFAIELPPLRKRMDDIPLLLNHFLEVFSKKNGATPKSFSEKAMNALVKYDWPGNVRELENMVERICTVVKKPVVLAHDITLSGIGPDRIRGLKLKEAVKVFKKQYVQEVLESVDGSRGMAADILGVHRNTILRDMV
jgi:two-component system response regulator AtoC